MRKSFFIVYMFVISSGFIFAVKPTDMLIGKNVSVFYPVNYDAKAHQPSLVFLTEPEVTGKIQKNWKFKPNFYSKNGQSVATFSIEKGTSLYGTGEVKGSLLRNDKKVKLWNTDNYRYLKDDGLRLYQSHPWVLGVNRDGSAFGIIADNTWKQKIDLSDSIRFISDSPAFRVIVIKRNSPQEVLKELAHLTGKMEMPPLWALGYQQCRYSYVPDTRIKSVADTFRLKNIPCDVIWMDIDYMDKYKIFTFDKTKILDPKGLNYYLHQKGFHTIWMIDPGVKVEKDYPVYESGTRGNHWVQTENRSEFIGKVWPGDCAFPDFTIPETRTWWSGLYKGFMATGVDGVWNDMNEPSVFDGPAKTMPENNWHRGGGGLPADIHSRYHNVYGMLMVKASREGILNANPDKRPFVLSRSGFLGSSRYAATWTGDNASTVDNMKMSIPMTLNLGLSGQPFNGPDMGGFALNLNGDLMGQWISIGAFFPFLRGHATNNANNKEPWAFGEEIENVSRTALNRRYRLLPYYYTLFHEAAESGLPVMRPVFFADPTDTTLRREDQIFLIGNDLLVVPKWAENPALPKGIWRIASIAGENSLHDNYQADVKIKGGAIIPLGKIIQNTTQFSLDSLTLLVSLDKNGRASGTMYEDSGEGFQYKKGEFLISSFQAHQSNSSVRVVIKDIQGNLKPRARSYKVRLMLNNGVLESDWTKEKVVTLRIPDASTLVKM